MNILKKNLIENIYVKKTKKISNKWIEQTREYVRDFLDETDFPDPDRIGERGPNFLYPGGLIMFIAVLSVKIKIKTYNQIHKMVIEYWDLIAKDLKLKPISERQLSGRLKKISQHSGKPATSFFKCFLNRSHGHVISSDKMMHEAQPVWLGTFHVKDQVDYVAMGLTIQMHQLETFKQGRSTWNVKEPVLG